MTEKEIAHILLDLKAVTLNVTEPFRYTSGILSPIYCDNRLLISYPEQRSLVIDAFVKIIQDLALEFDTVGGTATAGIPHAAWIADRLQKPMVYIRSKAKEHGKQNQVEGLLASGTRVLVIEDLISTGGSSVDAAEAVRQEGGVVTDCLAIFTYQLPKATQRFADAAVNLHTLTNFTSLVEVAEEMGYLTPEQKAPVLDWNTDPEGWGKKMGFEQ